MLKNFGRDLVNVECYSEISFFKKISTFNTAVAPIFDQIWFLVFYDPNLQKLSV